MPSGSRPVPPPGRPPRPLKHLAGTLADPRDQAWCARVKPEVAALLLAQEPASHTLAARWWPRRTPQALGRSDDQGLGQGSTGLKDGPDLEDELHAATTPKSGPEPT